jgi:hypothetical protein
MKLRSMWSTGLVAFALALATVPVSAQVDVSGNWALEVTTDQSVTTPSVTFVQDGTELSGRYTSEVLGDADVQGTVDGASVSWSFSADLQGQTVPVRYRGTVADDGTMSGTIDIASGMLTGRFTATRPGS